MATKTSKSTTKPATSMKTIVVEWSNGMTIPEAINSKEVDGRGVYQITKTIKEKEKEIECLLYIGLVKSSNRNFWKRLLEHLEKGVLRKEKEKDIMQNIYIYFGKITSEDCRVTKTLIEEVEGAMIFEVEPGKNIMKRDSYQLREDIIIKSVGKDRAFIPPTINTKKHPWN